MSDLYTLPDSNIQACPTFTERHSLAIRIWHWTFFLVLTASLVTVLFGSTLFKTKKNIAIVQSQLQEKGVTVDKDQARAVAHMYSDKLWDLHTLLGYIVCGLLLSRIIIEIVQPGEERLGIKLKKALGFKTQDVVEQKAKRHYIQVKWTYIIFYCMIGTMALTGLGLAFEDVPFLKDAHRTITQVHSFVQYFIYAFIIIHLGGVVRSDLSKYNGLVSGMIHGKGTKL
jgi:Ni/Fe-hydrogenase 1 B-type cytochrome subunit